MKQLPTWTYRDLETSITWLLDAAANLSEIEDDPNISRQTRTHASDARTNVKATLMLLREIRSQHEAILTENGSIDGTAI